MTSALRVGDARAELKGLQGHPCFPPLRVHLENAGSSTCDWVCFDRPRSPADFLYKLRCAKLVAVQLG